MANKAPGAGRPGDADLLSTSITVPRSILAVLRRVAAERAIRTGARVSISAVVLSIIERALPDLEKEARGGK